MKIKVNDKYTVTSNDLSFMLIEKSISTGEKTKGQELEKVVGYYSNIKACFKAIIDRDIKKSDATSFRELVEVVQTAKADIDKCLKVLGLGE